MLLPTSQILSLPAGLLALIFASVLSTNASKPSPLASPEAQTNLICHTTNAAECYPAIFSPTKDFQMIRYDQSIPPGLHVRMNLATGLKEARLNVPEEDGGDKSAVVILENSYAQDQGSLVEEVAGYAGNVQTPDSVEEAPKSNDPPRVPKILDPKSHSTEHTFDTLVAAILSNSDYREDDRLLEDLTSLTELAHDIEWGLSMTSSVPLISTLLQHIQSGFNDIASASTILLATSLQNNPQALQKLLSHTPEFYSSPTKIAIAQLSYMLMAHESTPFGPMPVTAESLTRASRLIFLLSQLCADDAQLEALMNEEGLLFLAPLFNLALEEAKAERGSDQFKTTKLQTKIANFAVDHAERIVERFGADTGLTALCVKLRTKFLEKFDRNTGGAAFASVCEARKLLERLLGQTCDTHVSSCEFWDVKGEL